MRQFITSDSYGILEALTAEHLFFLKLSIRALATPATFLSFRVQQKSLPLGTFIQFVS